MRKLVAEQLADDRRIAQAKALLADALKEHQRKLTGVRPADPDRKLHYDRVLAQFGTMRGGALYYPYLASGIGRGPLVELADGSVKYDFITGIGVHYLGHSHPALVEAGLDAALADTTMQGNLQQQARSADLVRMLLDSANASGARLAHCFLTTSGAMANENALKMIFHCRAPASRLLAFANGFAGRTLALAQVTDRANYRVGLPQTLNVDFVPFFDPDRPAESTARALAVLREHLERFPQQHAGMIFELIQGEAGYNVGSRDFFVALMDVLREAGVAILVDEVQTFGRTSQPFAFQHFGLDGYVDAVTVGKLTQACATLVSGDLKPAPGIISQTFTASTSAMFAAEAILRELTTGDYFGDTGRNMALGAHVAGRLEAMAARHPTWLRGPWGLGSMVAMTVFDGTPEQARQVALALFEAGVIGFVAGHRPARIRFLLPAGAVSTEDIDTVCDMLETVLGSLARS